MNHVSKESKSVLKHFNMKSRAIQILGVLVMGIFASILGLSYSYYHVEMPSNVIMQATAIISSADIELRIYMQDRNESTGAAISGQYTRVYYIPTQHYTYNSSKKTCTGGVDVTYNENTNTFDMTASSTGVCSVYFDVTSGDTALFNTKIRLFVLGEDGVYFENGQVPADGQTYTVASYECFEPNTTTASSATVNFSINSNRQLVYTTNKDVECDVYIKVKATLSKTVMLLADGSERTSSQDSSVYRVIDQDGVRYEGADPDNYVEFNDGESWRIIGTFEGSTIGLESAKYYTKIIKSESLGLMEWDWEDADGDGIQDSGEYVNDWTEATLNTYLNGTYKTGLNDTSESMIAKATWYLGGHSSAYITSDVMYDKERGSIGANGTTVASKLSHQNYIGLMYPSDYGYAMYADSSNTTCDNTSIQINRYSNCKQYDWLSLGSTEWTISPYSGSSYWAFSVDVGPVLNGYVDDAYAVRPALYLEASVEVQAGQGTEANPYIIQ